MWLGHTCPGCMGHFIHSEDYMGLGVMGSEKQPKVKALEVLVKYRSLGRKFVGRKF